MLNLKNIGILDYSEDKIKEVINNLEKVGEISDVYHRDFISTQVSILKSVLEKLSKIE